MNNLKLKKEMKKDIYRSDYLDRYNLKPKILDISAIIPTFNRCPFPKTSKNFLYNPLAICIESIFLQKFPIKEIIIVDDNSNDNILDVVNHFTDKKIIPIKYFKNNTNKGSAISRNIAVKRASGKLCLFLDDDCVLAPYVSFLSHLSFIKMKKINKKIAVLILPTYNHRTYPLTTLKKDVYKNRISEVGKQNPNYATFVEEYLDSKVFIEKKYSLLRPVKTNQAWGYFLSDRKDYVKAGGFPEHFNWSNKSGEEVEFAERILDSGKELYYLPDPKACSLHGAFGSKEDSFSGFDWMSKYSKLSLKRFVEICNSYNKKTGNRVSKKELLYSKLTCLIVLKLPRSLDSAKQSINYFFENLIEKNNLFVDITKKDKINLFKKAIKNALMVVEDKRNNKDFIFFIKDKYPLLE